MLFDKGCIHGDGFVTGAQIRRVVGDFLQQALENGVQPPCAYIFSALIDLIGNFSDASHAILGKCQLQVFSGHQFTVLLGQRCLGFG